MSTFLQLGHYPRNFIVFSPLLSFLQMFLHRPFLSLYRCNINWNLKKRERENHVAIIFYGIHNDTRKYVNTRRKRCKESFSNERSPAWSSRHRSESTKHGHKNSRDTFADTSLDTKSYFHPTNSWIRVELRVTRMEKKRCHNGRHLFLAFHPKTTRHVSPSSSLIATSLATKVALIHTHTYTHRQPLAISIALYRHGRRATEIDHPEVFTHSSVSVLSVRVNYPSHQPTLELN